MYTVAWTRVLALFAYAIGLIGLGPVLTMITKQDTFAEFFAYIAIATSLVGLVMLIFLGVFFIIFVTSQEY